MPVDTSAPASIGADLRRTEPRDSRADRTGRRGSDPRAAPALRGGCPGIRGECGGKRGLRRRAHDESLRARPQDSATVRRWAVCQSRRASAARDWRQIGERRQRRQRGARVSIAGVTRPVVTRSMHARPLVLHAPADLRRVHLREALHAAAIMMSEPLRRRADAARRLAPRPRTGTRRASARGRRPRCSVWQLANAARARSRAKAGSSSSRRTWRPSVSWSPVGASRPCRAVGENRRDAAGASSRRPEGRWRRPRAPTSACCRCPGSGCRCRWRRRRRRSRPARTRPANVTWRSPSSATSVAERRLRSGRRRRASATPRAIGPGRSGTREWSSRRCTARRSFSSRRGGAQRLALAVPEALQVDDVGDDGRVDAEAAKHVDQKARRHHVELDGGNGRLARWPIAAGGPAPGRCGSSGPPAGPAPARSRMAGSGASRNDEYDAENTWTTSARGQLANEEWRVDQLVDDRSQILHPCREAQRARWRPD